ncbi:MAG: alpha-L-fucosidase, partial [Bacteroidales bacterium]|nr:alpha-L-fucosidase [Bacteroidales bacterium]
MHFPKRLILFGIVFLFSFRVISQSNSYLPPTDSLVKQKLENWQDMKFGLLMHWGLYSQLGVVESWGLCSEDQDFQDRNGMDYIDYKNHYFGQIRKFNPQQFNPDIWAEAAQKAGMKYVVFTTKHHDGFCMFDTKQTDFKITSG